ncbi:hypothetical protein HNQ02_003281 [Flavobacterium sp. 7E]|uniref:STM3941 family protein n=1 Tax=Flavobacterium sp. 7E TaxID=2735898 RepID=UPI00156E6C63|nr:STM3941 family protein [Flavobacterium sp. 7E]NRS90341.1 hypothetical protein [Flavobacterium sp. 7E]
MNKIEISLNKTKLALSILGAFSIVFFGILFIINPDIFVSPFLRSAELVKIIGIIGVLLFSILGVFGVKKLLDKKAGLTIGENGITDNTNSSSVGFIKWDDITDIKAEQFMSIKFLLIFTHDPNEILKETSGIKRKILQGNIKKYGTPILITSTNLKCDFDDLNKLLTDKLNEKREKKLN